MAKSMLNGKGLLKSLWAEALNIFVYILNMSVTKAAEGKTPKEAYNGKKPSVAHFKVFGIECFMHIQDEERTKVE